MGAMTGKTFSLNMPSTVRLSQRCNRSKALWSPQCCLCQAVNETGLRGRGGEKPASYPLTFTLEEISALILPKGLWQSLRRGDGVPGCWDAAHCHAKPWHNTNSLCLPQQSPNIGVTYQQGHQTELMLFFSIYSLNRIHIQVYETV